MRIPFFPTSLTEDLLNRYEYYLLEYGCNLPLDLPIYMIYNLTDRAIKRRSDRLNLAKENKTLI